MDTSATTAAERLLERLRDFVTTLDDEERALFAALIAPAVAQAHSDANDVVGFGTPDETAWSPQALPSMLTAAIRGHDVRVVGLGG